MYQSNTILYAAGHLLCRSRSSHIIAARNLSDGPSQKFPYATTLKSDGFGVDHQQKGHICDVSAGIKEDGEGTARGQQIEKPPGDPMVEQELITMHVPLCITWCSSEVAKRCVHSNSSALLLT